MSGQPYTHAAHAARCRDAAIRGHVLSSQHVQVMRRGVLYCAQLVNAWTTPDGVDCWTVETSHPEIARFTVPCRQVRLCADRCVCDAGRADGGYGPDSEARHSAAIGLPSC